MKKFFYLFFAAMVMVAMSVSFVSCGGDEEDGDVATINQYYGCTNAHGYRVNADFDLVTKVLNDALKSAGAIPLGSGLNVAHCVKNAKQDVTDKKIKEACDAAIKNFDKSKLSGPVGIIVTGFTGEKYTPQEWANNHRDVVTYIIEP